MTVSKFIDDIQKHLIQKLTSWIDRIALITPRASTASCANRDTKETPLEAPRTIAHIEVQDPSHADVMKLVHAPLLASTVDASAKETSKDRNVIDAARRHMDYAPRALMDASSVTAAG